MSVSLAGELIALLEPLALQQGLDLVTVETAGGAGHPTVRVFLDREGGIDIEAIAQANGWIAEALESVSRLSGPYTLEVSSPGIERALRTPADFVRFAGERVSVRLAHSVAGRSKFTAELRGMEEGDVLFHHDGEELRVPLDAIERARLKADF